MIHILDLLINWCLVFVISFNLINLWAEKLRPIPDLLDRVMTISAYYFLFHALHVLLAINFFPHIRYINWAAPFGLGYGPLLFFGVRALRLQPFKWSLIILHLSPLLLFFVAYLLGFIENQQHGFIYRLLRANLYPLTLLSFVGYALYAIAQSRRPGIISTANLQLISRATFLALLTSVLLIAILLNNNNNAVISYLIPRLFLYILMLTISALLLHRRLIGMSQPRPLSSISSPTPTQKSYYGKSRLSKAALLVYQERLEAAIHTEKIFLDATLSIDKLSQQLDIPRHHLSQVFNVQIGKNFSVYINEARIRHACDLLLTQPSIAMEQLAYQCGFNSKVSFYRHFKRQVGSTPMTYLKRIKHM